MEEKKLTNAEKKEYFRKRKAEILAKQKATDKKWQHLIRNIGHDFVEEKDPKKRDKQLRPRRSLAKNLVK